MPSLSSQMMSSITLFRNPNGTEQQWARMINPVKIVLAEIGYITTIIVAIAETALSSIAKLFSLCLPLSQERHKAMSNWVNSSAFCISWSLCNSILNIICNDLIVTEKVARVCKGVA